VAQCGWVL